jgi:acetoin utilization protein AcuC
MGKLAIIYHDDFRAYDLGDKHPFRGNRYDCLPQVLSHAAIAACKEDITFLRPKPAADEAIRWAHGDDYVDFIQSLDQAGGTLTLDTPVPPGLYGAVKLFAGANILAGRLVAEGLFRRVVVLGLGAHHAGYDFGGGFCIINDIAVMIEFLRKHYGVRRIALLDFDAHCGNGTQDIYYDDPEVLCFDFHQDPLTFFPGSGFAYQIGLGEGKGYTVNLPFAPGASDDDYLKAFNEICLPIAQEFQPEIIIANGGLDAHCADPLSGLNLSLQGFSRLFTAIGNLARQICGNKFILILGGSYEPRIVPAGWITSLAAMLDLEEGTIDEPMAPPAPAATAGLETARMMQTVKQIQQTYWSGL